MSLGIATYGKPISNGKKGNGGLSEKTKELRQAILASVAAGNASMIWPGAAKDGGYQKNGQSLRVIAKNFITDDAPRGFKLSLGFDGDDLTFVAKVWPPNEPEAVEEIVEAAPETAKPTPPKAGAKPATAKK